MKRETFLFTKTIRDVKTGYDQSRISHGKIATTAKLMRGGKELVQPKVNEQQVAVALEQEKRRFAKQMQTLEKGRKKVTALREKLAGTVEKNKRLMALRNDLQKQYWSRGEEPAVKNVKKRSEKKTRQIKLGY